MRALNLAWHLAVAGSFFGASPSMAEPCLDIALVLAVDVSGSVNAGEYALQTNGIAGAFRHDEVRAAARSAGRVAVSVVFWADEAFPVVIIGWHDVSANAGAETLATAVENTPRELYGSTGIGRGVWEALELLDASGFCAHRKLINVSGDGVETLAPRFYSNKIDARRHISLSMAKQRAESLGVTINALAITDGQSQIVNYYKTHLISGPGAFVMEISSYSDFADAIKLKMLREIEPNIARFSKEDMFALLVPAE